MASHHIETVSEVIDALGGTTACGRLILRSPQAVCNWRQTNVLPAVLFLRMTEELHARGYTAPARLWGIEEPFGAIKGSCCTTHTARMKHETRSL
jgi:hypothetical protein